MIVFDLKCGAGHVFEAWFASSSAYDRQRADGLVICPICQDSNVAKAVMAPAIPAKGNQRQSVSPQPITPSPAAPSLPPELREKLAQAMGELAQAQAKAIAQSQWVGDKFADEARAMHYGDREQASIHGTANLEDAKAMLEEGLAVTPLLFPVAPPDQVN